MAKLEYDGILEAVHYQPDGQVDWVRVFERRGATFSDYLIYTRNDFIGRLKAGRKFMTGRRIPQMGGTFEVWLPVRLVNHGDQELLAAGDPDGARDSLTGVPRI